MTRWSPILAIACCVFLVAETDAQMGPESHPSQSAAGIMEALPPPMFNPRCSS